MKKEKAFKKRNEKFRIDSLVGNNLRTERTMRKMSREELADMMGLTISHLGLIERGERGATAVNLERFSRVFNISVDNFFRESQTKTAPDGKMSKTRLNISELIMRLDEHELDFILNMLNGMVTFKHKIINSDPKQ